MEGAAQPPGPKRKLTRKQQLAESRRLKARYASERVERVDDPEFVPEPEEELPDADDDALCPEEPGAAAQRQRQAYNRRRSTERLRGVTKEAGSMRAFLFDPARELAREVAAAAVQNVLSALVEERKAAKREAKADRERERYASRKRKAETQATPPARVPTPRLGRTFSDAKSTARGSGTKRVRSDEAPPESQKRRRKAGVLTKEMQASIVRISSKRSFMRSDILNGEDLNRSEWAQLQRDYLELRKVFALNVFIRERNRGTLARTAFEAAGKVATNKDGKPANWQTVRKWLNRFINQGGRVYPDQRGRSPSTNTYLDDLDTKEAAPMGSYLASVQGLLLEGL